MTRKRLFEAEQEQPCPTCLTKAGKRCVTQFGMTTDYPHAARHTAWCNTKDTVQTFVVKITRKEAQR